MSTILILPDRSTPGGRIHDSKPIANNVGLGLTIEWQSSQSPKILSTSALGDIISVIDSKGDLFVFFIEKNR
jgi:hypothetical protein